MSNAPAVPQGSPAIFQTGQLKIKYLMPNQLQRLMDTWREWFDASPTPARRRIRGRHWLIFLTLRHTGARLGEVLQIRDDIDINTRESEIRITTLKRGTGEKRLVPVVPELISEIASYLMDYPEIRGKLFSLDASNFRKRFYDLADQAGMLEEEYVEGRRELFPHPHTLRHTRAMELLSAGVPVTAVQDLLGHSSLLTTAQYLRLSGQDVKNTLRSKGL